jgi:hypothetical protein
LASASLEKARQIFEGLRTQQRANADDLYNLAVVCALRGPDYHDKALAMLGQAVRSGYRNVARLESDTAFIPLRPHDKFKEMLSSLREK